MTIVYTLLAAISCMGLVVAVDLIISKVFSENSIFQKEYVKMPISYFIGILIFLMIVKVIFK